MYNSDHGSSIGYPGCRNFGYAEYRISGIRYPVSGIRYPVSGIRYPVSGWEIWETLNKKYLTGLRRDSSFFCRTFGAEHGFDRTLAKQGPRQDLRNSLSCPAAPLLGEGNLVASRARLHVFACFDVFESHGRNLEPGVRFSESVTCEIGLVGEYVLLIVRWPSCAPEKCRGP